MSTCKCECRCEFECVWMSVNKLSESLCGRVRVWVWVQVCVSEGLRPWLLSVSTCTEDTRLELILVCISVLVHCPQRLTESQKSESPKKTLLRTAPFCLTYRQPPNGFPLWKTAEYPGPQQVVKKPQRTAEESAFIFIPVTPMLVIVIKTSISCSLPSCPLSKEN